MAVVPGTHYRSVAPGAVSPGTCSSLRVCSASEYNLSPRLRQTAVQASHNVFIVPVSAQGGHSNIRPYLQIWRVCANEREVKAPTATSDRVRSCCSLPKGGIVLLPHPRVECTCKLRVATTQMQFPSAARKDRLQRVTQSAQTGSQVQQALRQFPCADVKWKIECTTNFCGTNWLSKYCTRLHFVHTMLRRESANVYESSLAHCNVRLEVQVL